MHGQIIKVQIGMRPTVIAHLRDPVSWTLLCGAAPAPIQQTADPPVPINVPHFPPFPQVERVCCNRHETCTFWSLESALSPLSHLGGSGPGESTADDSTADDQST